MTGCSYKDKQAGCGLQEKEMSWFKVIDATWIIYKKLKEKVLWLRVDINIIIIIIIIIMTCKLSNETLMGVTVVPLLHLPEMYLLILTDLFYSITVISKIILPSLPSVASS